MRRCGFQKGGPHPSKDWAERVRVRKVTKAVRAKQRVVEARAAATLGDLRLPAGGSRDRLSTREALRAVHLVSTDGMTQLGAAAAVGVSQSTVSRLLSRVEAALDAEAAGDEALAAVLDPTRSFKRSSSGRPKLVVGNVETAVREVIERDPWGNVGDWQAALETRGVCISHATLYRAFHELHIPKRAANNYAQLSPVLLHGLMNHVEAIRNAVADGKLLPDNVAYADQTPITVGEGRGGGRSEGILYGTCGDVKGGKMLWSLWAVVTNKGVLRAWITKKTGDETTAKEFFLSDTLPAGWECLFGAPGNIFGVLKAHGRTLAGRDKRMVLCLDRLGKSGGSEYCVAGHHVPELRVRARRTGVGLLMLPPKGALVNPIERWNSHVKWLMRRWQPDGEPVDEWGHIIRGPRNEEEAKLALIAAIKHSHADPSCLRHAYHARFDGAELLRRLKSNTTAAAVRAERAAAPVPPFDVWTAAFAPRARMSTVHAYPASEGVAETYNVYFYCHQFWGLHEGLPPPFARSQCDKGLEEWCRMCKPQTNASVLRKPRCVVCDTCPGVFHQECVGLSAVPKGAWQCAGCARGENVVPRVWDKALVPPRDPSAPQKKRKVRSDKGTKRKKPRRASTADE